MRSEIAEGLKVMKHKAWFGIALGVMSSPAFAGWHYLEKVVKVTVRGDEFYVQGSNPTGHACASEANYYGTLMHASSQSGHKEFFSLALLAQTTEKGLACYVYTARPDGVCIMENCHLL